MHVKVNGNRLQDVEEFVYLGHKIVDIVEVGPLEAPKRLIGLAFACALGVTFLVLACALPQYNNWWPMFVLFFYFLSPLPTIVARRLSNSYDSSSSACIELCIFLTTGIVISSVGLPIVLAHVEVIQWGACALVTSGNIVVFLTILGYFKIFGGDDVNYSMW